MINRSTVRLFPILFACSFSLRLYPQLLEVPINKSVEPSFNKKFVADHKIKNIKALVASKADNDIVKEMGIVQGYEFDGLGNTTKTYTAQLNTNTLSYDTIATKIYYDKDQNIILKRSNKGVFYDARYYEYDENKKLKKETHCRETNSNIDGPEFKLGVQLILSQESFKYDSLGPYQWKKTHLNDENRVYKQGIINKDSIGRIVEENYNFAVGWIKIKINYKYDTLGRMIGRTNWTNENGDIKEDLLCEYDQAHGNLIGEKKFRNDTQTEEASYLYDEQKKLLKSVVTRYPLEKRIGIVKYSYEFYR